MMTYIYALIDPRTDGIRYVGKTMDIATRLRRHETEAGRTHKHNWLKQLREAGCSPQMLILEDVEGDNWGEREAWWISHYRVIGAHLTNHCSGGNGAPGISPSEETRQKLSQSVGASWQRNPRTISDEHLAALVAGRRAMPQSAGARAKIGAANSGRVRSPETRRRIAASKRGVSHKPIGEEGRRKISQALQGEGNGMAKLTMEKAREIRKRYATENISLSQLGVFYGVDPKQIHRIVREQAWMEQELTLQD